MIEWVTGEISRESLTIIAADDTVTYAVYAKNKNLLEIKGWKVFKEIAKRQKKYLDLQIKKNSDLSDWYLSIHMDFKFHMITVM